MQLFHLGFSKTGTKSLQRNLFIRCPREYFGNCTAAFNYGGSLRAQWNRFLCGAADRSLSALRNTDFIFSQEGTFLLCGGMRNVERIAQTIATVFKDPRILLTTREPARLLASAYFQSLRLRRIALGFRDSLPLRRKSVQFVGFREWWNLLKENEDVSYAGLLDYPRVVAALAKYIDRKRITVLPLEWMKSDQPKYVNALRDLGFDERQVADFLAAPPENAGANKLLRRPLRGFAPSVGGLLVGCGFGDALERTTRSRSPLSSLTSFLFYTDTDESKAPWGHPDKTTLSEISDFYARGEHGDDSRTAK